MSDELSGKAVLVTGAGRGLGRAFAKASSAAGARVVVNDVDGDEARAVVKEITESGGLAQVSVADVATWNGAQSTVDACREAFGRIDGLVNNAGVFYQAVPWDELEDQVRRIVEVNILGSLFVGIHAARAMRENGGAIVNITSQAHWGLPNMATYAATKGAMSSMAYSWAIDLEASQIRVNAVAPTAHTRMTPAGPGLTPQARADPNSVAPVVVFLLSDLSEPLSGKTLHFNGKDLSVVVPPHFGSERLQREQWNASEIAEACRGPLNDLLTSEA
jgi:NAD(P)-dependent dehydrogenase (short-subunit alcohol dehydrogenase family)